MHPPLLYPCEKSRQRERLHYSRSPTFLSRYSYCTRHAYVSLHEEIAIQSTLLTWFGHVDTICDDRTLSPHDTTPGYFSIADTDSIKPINKRARKDQDEYTKAAQALGEEILPGHPGRFQEADLSPIMRHGPSLTHLRAHEVSNFCVDAFGELSARCSGLCNLAARA